MSLKVIFFFTFYSFEIEIVNKSKNKSSQENIFGRKLEHCVGKYNCELIFLRITNLVQETEFQNAIQLNMIPKQITCTLLAHVSLESLNILGQVFFS